MSQLTPEFKLIVDWIKPNSRVLDLGCGDGALLKHLQEHSNVTGYGMELDPQLNIQAMNNGVNTIQSDLNNHELVNFFDPDSFDFVVMTQTLQAIKRPDILLEEMLSLGKEGIITFPNFAHWKMRAQLVFKGRMPVTKTLPYSWYDTPNIHLCTFKDFEDFCDKKNIQITDKAVVNSEHKSSLGMKLLPNLLGEIALYKVRKHD